MQLAARLLTTLVHYILLLVAVTPTQEDQYILYQGSY